MSFTVYKSSAGSGKTYTLVKEYIILTLKKPSQFKHILAITFTNKAANEMKERVIQYLTELSAEKLNRDATSVKHLLPELIKETAFSEEEIKIKAHQVLQSILHNYSDFAISTIDSFVHKIIRTFAHDLKIPLNFEVELDTDLLLTNAIDLLLQKAGTDEKLTKILVEYIENKTEDDKSWHIENDLHKFAQQLLKEDNLVHIEKIKSLSIQQFLDIRIKLNKLKAIFEKNISVIAQEAYEIISKNNIAIKSFYQGEKGIGKYFQDLSIGKYNKISPNSYVIDTIENDRWYSKTLNDIEKNNIENIKEKLIEYYNKISNYAEKHHKKYILYQLILNNIYPVAVLNEIEKTIDEIKKEDNILPITEFNKKISAIVCSQPVPFIYERIGEKFHHYLIDEFQDTSSLQWMNLLPLIENSLSYNYFNMIVGDAKQGIYRWRGGDIEQFAILPAISDSIKDEYSKEREASLIRNFEGKNLDANYRSKKELVEFNNAFFAFIAQISSDYIKNIFNNSKQKFNKLNTGGYVEINFLHKDKEIETPSEVALDKVVETIHHLIQNNYKPKDIAILCRSNIQTSIIASHLILNGIAVISDESLLISSSEDVSFLIAWANFILNTEDEIAKCVIIHYLINHQKVFDLGYHTLIRSLQKIDKASPPYISTDLFIAYLNKNSFSINPLQLSGLPVYEFFEKMITLFKLERNTDAFIRYFQENIFLYTQKKQASLAGFMEWWEENKGKKSIIISGDTDAVKVMTIHKSKGLEFPVVILPFATETISKTLPPLWIEPAIAEIPELKSSLISNNKTVESTAFSELHQVEKYKSMLDLLNLLYVAMTRPKEHLYIFTTYPSKEVNEPSSNADFFYLFLKNNALWEENKQTYSFGNNEIKRVEEDKEALDEIKPISIASLKTQEQVIHIKKKANDLWDTENPTAKSEWGNIIHYAFSLIFHEKDIDNAIAHLILKGMIVKENQKEITQQITAIISNPLLNPYFKSDFHIKNEAEILLKDGSIIRPDRIVIKDQEVIVIDYKTGIPSQSHHSQIEMYANTLTEMGYKQIKKILVYIDQNKIVEV